MRGFLKNRELQIREIQGRELQGLPVYCILYSGLRGTNFILKIALMYRLALYVL